MIPEDAIVNKIESDFVVVEVVDRNTGKLFRRKLPLNYLETDNGIILSGENTECRPVQIAFLSDAALNKIIDVTGKGRDTQRCEK